MKKNILIIQSLLVLPLIISSSLLSMERGEHPLLNELIELELAKIEQRNFNNNNPTPNFTNNVNPYIFNEQYEPMPVFPETATNSPFCYVATEMIQESDVFQDCATNGNSSDIVHDTFSKETTQKKETYKENSLLASRISVEQLQSSPLFKHQQTLYTSQVQSDEASATSVQTIEVTVAQNTKEAQPVITEQPTALGLESVMLPTKKKKLDGWKRFDAFAAKIDITGIYTTISNVISYLQKNTYDFNNVKHLNILHQALTEAAEADDFDSLIKIAALCQSTEDYKKNVRINSEVATSAFDVLTTKFNQELDRSNNTINNMYQANVLKIDAENAALVSAFNTYLKNIKAISEDTASKYTALREQEDARIKPIQESITTFSRLNKSIRPKTAELLTHTIQPKENKITEEYAQAEGQLKSLLGIIDKMPKVENTTVLQLTK